MAHIAQVSILGSSLFQSFQFRMVNPTITFQSHTNKQSILIQEYENKSTRYQISIVIQTIPSLQAYNQCNHVGLPNPQLLQVVGDQVRELEGKNKKSSIFIEYFFSQLPSTPCSSEGVVISHLLDFQSMHLFAVNCQKMFQKL